MTQEKATVRWTTDAPTIDGVYWWRANESDYEPDIHEVSDGFFYQVGFSSSEVVVNFGGEWLGPITPDDFGERNALLSEVAQLREVLAQATLPYQALLMDAESRKWIAPEIWSAIEAAVTAARELKGFFS